MVMKNQPFTVLLLSVVFAFAMIGCQTTKQCPMKQHKAKCDAKCTMKCDDKCSTMCGTKCGQ